MVLVQQDPRSDILSVPSSASLSLRQLLESFEVLSGQVAKLTSKLGEVLSAVTSLEDTFSQTLDQQEQDFQSEEE